MEKYFELIREYSKNNYMKITREAGGKLQYTELYKTKLNASYMHYIEEKKAELNK